MEPKEIADLFLRAVGKVEFYWNFYAVTLVALIGWFVTTKKPLGGQLKLLIALGYVCFVSFNMLALWNSYDFAEALRLDFLAAIKKEAILLPKTVAILTRTSYALQQKLMIGVHILLGIGVMLVLIYARKDSDTSTRPN